MAIDGETVRNALGCDASVVRHPGGRAAAPDHLPRRPDDALTNADEEEEIELMDSYLLVRMAEYNRSELTRVRAKRDWLSILRAAR